MADVKHILRGGSDLISWHKQQSY